MQKKSVKVITITGGKGGIGKTFFSVNFAIELLKRGYRVLLFDGDFNLSNVQIMLNVNETPKYFSSFINSGGTLNDLITRGVGGIDIIFAGSDFDTILDLNLAEIKRLITGFNHLYLDYDYVIIDTSSGVSELIRNFIKISHDVIFITTPEITAINDFYRTLDFYKSEKKNNKKKFYFLINKVKSVTSGIKLLRLLEENIKREENILNNLEALGVIYRDEDTVNESIQRRIPLVMLFDKNTVRGSISSIVDKYLGTKEKTIPKRFIERIINSFK